MAIELVKTLYVAPMSYGAADPSANGSGYSYVPTVNPATKRNMRSQLATQYAVGGIFPTRPEAGPDGGEIRFRTVWGGLASIAGDGAAPPANDWLDILLTSAFGTQRLLSGEGVGVASTTTNLVLDAGTDYTFQDLLAVYEVGLSVGRTQWAMATTDPGTNQHAVAPAFAVAPTTAAIAYGSKTYRQAAPATGVVACVFVDDTVGVYTALSGRVMLNSIEAQHGELYIADWTIRFDSKTLDVGKSSLPAITAGPAFPPAQARNSPVYFNGTAYETKSVRIDFQPRPLLIGATSAPNGRGGDENLCNPRVTIEPRRNSAIEALSDAVTQGPLLVQMGAGILNGSVLGTTCLHIDNASPEPVQDLADDQYSRQTVTFAVADRVFQSAGQRSHNVQLARA
jgi:hypothetical protein